MICWLGFSGRALTVRHSGARFVCEHRLIRPRSVSDSLQYSPEKCTIVAMYKQLVVGAAFLSSPQETYITYLAVRSGWDNSQIAKSVQGLAAMSGTREAEYYATIQIYALSPHYTKPT